ncbi:MAG TPA: FAD-dependent oxidoreductase, partial [Arenibaculum sp.]|nr:FAD-dependent oxidoreductase [Arenibaculum sp.]
EETRALAVADGDPATVTTATGTVRARDVIVATNLPFIPEGGFHKKTGPRSHVAVASTIAEERAPDGLFLSIDTPTHSVRTAPYQSGSRLLVVVGQSYATGGVKDVSGMVRDLTRFVADHFPDAGPVRWYWTNMDYDSLDRVPFVGRASKDVEHVHVATGFSSWGISNGTAAGILLCEVLCGRSSPWAGLYDATRTPAEAPNRGHPPMRSDDVGGPREGEPGELAPGEAAVFGQGDEKVAAYRDEQGALHTVSAACTHLGCTVAWNDAARSWECPCHGSVFGPDGRVLKGPAVRDLAHRGGRGDGRGGGRGDGRGDG